MRFLWVLVMGLVVLPVAGCGEKEDQPANQSAANNQPPGANPMPVDEGMPGPIGDPMVDPMTAGATPAGGPGDEALADAGGSQNREFFDEGMPDGGAPSEGQADLPEAATPAQLPGGEPDDLSDAGPSETPGAAPKEESKPSFGTRLLNFFTGGGDKNPATKPGEEGMPSEAHTEGGLPGVPGTAEGDLPGVPGTAEGGLPGVPGTGVGAGVAGEAAGGAPAIRKPTDIPGVKEGTPQYTAASLILKISRGESEGLESLIAEDVTGLLKDLRSKPDEETMKKAKDLMGNVKLVNSRLVDRDTVLYLQNTNKQILQMYLRRIQGEYVVTELRVNEAPKRAPARGRRK